VWSSRRGSRSIEHIGSAHDQAELAALKAAAERLAAGQAVLDLGVTAPAGSEPMPITSSQMTHLWGQLCAAYRILGFESATKGDTVFRDLVCASPRVLVTDKLRSYAVAHRAVMPSVEHRQSQYLNNRAQNSR
jgi:hypothetical protein